MKMTPAVNEELSGVIAWAVNDINGVGTAKNPETKSLPLKDVLGKIPPPSVNGFPV